MPELTIRISGEVHVIAFEPGPSVREILDATDFRVRSACRGIGACGLCRVRVLGGEVGEPTTNERVHLHPSLLAQGVRLSCQIKPWGNLDIEILNPAPPSNWKASPEGLFRRHDAAAPPHAKSYPAQVAHPCGLAVDIGTTNLCFTLLDLVGGRWLADRWGRNPQARFGADVVTRLAAAAESPDAARKMSDAVVEGVREALLDIASREGLNLRRIVCVTLVGNTGMLALLSGKNFSLLLQPAYWTRYVDCLPEDTAPWVAHWEIHPQAVVEVVPPLAGFVGSDLLAGLVATRFTEGPAPALFIDFGTNSEIALWNGEALWVTAAAGGPAFESSGIGWGIPAEPGAIFRVTRDEASGDFRYRIIGDDQAKGLCGSGLVDLTACLLRAGRLDRTGRFVGGGGFSFSAGGKPMAVTKGDIDLLQRAKAAIGVGVRALCEAARTGLGDLRRVCVAGAFGRFLDVANAQAIGLLPVTPPEVVELAGNTALAGCSDILLSSVAAEQVERLRGIAHTINLSRYPRFEDAFLENLYLQPLQDM
jgi:uncharacterized 2Fe-2S/4Fe-4S cluster protein (DUF4445 family)